VNIAASGRLSFGVIGAGPVGVVLAQALAAAGHQLIGISAVSSENLERIDAMLPDAELLQVDEIIERSDLVLLAIPAGQILDLVNGAAETKLWRAGQLLAHTSGQHGYGILSPASQQGVIALAIHPAMRFTGTSIDLARIRESYFAVNAPKVALPIAEALVIEMGAEPFVVSEADRAKYFEAYEVATNFSAMIVNQAIGLLEEVGLSDPRAVIAPVVRSAVEQALASGHQPFDPDELAGGRG
jgi:predicted short-subunit dehydrogenase-like oxidoreductase (DUF2520 family)